MTAQHRQMLALLKLPMEAVDLANLLGWPIEVTYKELATLEAMQAVKVRIEHAGKRIAFRGWVAA